MSRPRLVDVGTRQGGNRQGLHDVSLILGAVGMVALVVVGGWDFLIDSLALNFGALAIMLGVLTWLMIPTQSRNGSVWAIAWAAVFAALFTFGLGAAVWITERSCPA